MTPSLPLSVARQFLVTLISLCVCSFVLAQQIQINDSVPSCDFGDLVFDLGFSGARLNSCKKMGSREYSLATAPENTPINHSPWYAFRVYSERKRTIEIYLHYNQHQHRYHPKISSDGKAWNRMEDEDVEVLFDGKAIKFDLRVGPEPVWVSAQEILDNVYYQEWIEQLGSLPFMEAGVLGTSMRGRDIRYVETLDSRNKYVVLIGHQHPPEITGALAMRFFLERLMQNDELATNFRNSHGILAVPNLNPDGIALGNWRHNAGGVDLNRDWGPFAQPETRLIRDELGRFMEEGAPQIELFLDFHSTNRDVFYTQDKPTERLPEFTNEWLTNLEDAIQANHPEYEVGIQPGHNPDLAVSKTYMNETFGIPAITVELGDDTDRAFIKEYAETAAEEMMKLLISSQ